MNIGEYEHRRFGKVFIDEACVDRQKSISWPNAQFTVCIKLPDGGGHIRAVYANNLRPLSLEE